MKEHEFSKGTVDNSLYCKKKGDDILIVVVYVDDIMFDSNNADFCFEFPEIMKSKFEMSMLGELSFFLGLQIAQLKKGIFISQIKYAKEMLEKF